jgi:hypothetical protein
MVGYFEKYALVVGLLSAHVKSNPTTKKISKQNAITKQIAYLQRIMKAKMVAFTRAMIQLAGSLRPFQIAAVGNTPKLELLSSFVMNNLENY